MIHSAPALSCLFLFVAEIFVNTHSCYFTGTHRKDNSCCTCHSVTTGINTFFGSCTGLFFCNNTFSAVDIKTFCSG